MKKQNFILFSVTLCSFIRLKILDIYTFFIYTRFSFDINELEPIKELVLSTTKRMKAMVNPENGGLESLWWNTGPLSILCKVFG